jgi:inosine/xanthosine triphosphate pyrophosphatase family protein
MYNVNTSNSGKQSEFKKFLGNCSFSSVDLAEIKSRSLTLVSAYKALDTGDNVVIDDTALQVSGLGNATDIKWLLSQLPNHIGKSASFYCTLAVKKGNRIFVYQGRVLGKIVSPKGKGFGFDNYFQPINSNKTLGQYKPNKYNARFLAIKTLLDSKHKRVYSNLKTWTGDYQND